MINEIGYSAEIILKGFNNNNLIKAKIDTGATLNSLHGNNVKVTGKTIEFDFGKNHIVMPFNGYQSIKTADSGIEQRPVVEFNVEIPQDGVDQDIVLNKLSFTINDRSNMDDKVLLGLNFIEAGKFTIVSDAEDPKEIKEEIDENIIVEDSRSDIINKVIEMIQFNDISLDEIIKFKGK